MPKSRRSSERARDRAQRGFTLLEVLGAVLVLGMLYSVLAEVAIQGLRAEGESRRRLEASLFADELMSEIEASIAAGEVPPVGVSLEEDEFYVIELEVSPINTGALLPPGVLGEEETLANLMGAQTDEVPIREIALTISWLEGDRELSVKRTTLGLSAMEFDAVPGGGSLTSADSDAIANPGPILDGGAGQTTRPKDAKKRRGRRSRSARLEEIMERRRRAREWREKNQ
jgi:prepilin-type N-terminal cleavage/methylation domain-containing protein